MADLTYNSTDLEGLGTDLTRITSDLKNDNDLKDVDISDVAHQTVVDAINDFVNDWDDKRKKLTNKVEALAEMASQSSEKFDQADRELANALLQE